MVFAVVSGKWEHNISTRRNPEYLLNTNFKICYCLCFSKYRMRASPERSLFFCFLMPRCRSRQTGWGRTKKARPAGQGVPRLVQFSCPSVVWSRFFSSFFLSRTGLVFFFFHPIETRLRATSIKPKLKYEPGIKNKSGGQRIRAVFPSALRNVTRCCWC